MPFVEIHQSLNLSIEDCVKADLHSLLNIINLLHEELLRMGQKYGRPNLSEGADRCVDILSHFAEDPDAALTAFKTCAGQMDRQAREVAAENPRAEADVRVLLAITGVLSDRLVELQMDRLAWTEVDAEEVFANLARFLDTTEIVSRGRFHIVYGANEDVGSGYRLDFEMKPHAPRVKLPPILHDILRDIVANARKYSEPPALITVRLVIEPDGEIELSVQDNGMGIPESEISNVVCMGYRASNAVNRRTMGGGLGLTKAYLTVKSEGGRFWIDSTEGEGTTIRLTMRPPTD